MTVFRTDKEKLNRVKAIRLNTETVFPAGFKKVKRNGAAVLHKSCEAHQLVGFMTHSMHFGGERQLAVRLF